MASKIGFVEYVAEQCRGAGEIAYKKMFGEYALYCNRKIFALVCDNEFFVKITDKTKGKYPDLPEKPPYDGAKNYFLVENVDDSVFLTGLVKTTCAALPEPKPKKPKIKKGK